MTTANIHPCTCPVCSIPDSEPFDVEPIDFLQCEWTFRHFSPHAFFGNETNEAWWKTFEPHAKPWILSAIAAGEIEGPIEAWHGAKTLISSGYDDCDGQREWLEMNGFQLLFETLGHGGLEHHQRGCWHALVYGLPHHPRHCRCSFGRTHRFGA